MLRYILALNSCSRTRNRAKSTIPGIVQQSLLASQSLALLTVLWELCVIITDTSLSTQNWGRTDTVFLYQLKTITPERSWSSAATISRWICTTIVNSHAAIQNSKSFSGSVKAHEIRAVATSLQLFNKVDLQAVLKTGRWSSGGTFTSFYLRDLCPQADSLRRTGPLVAAENIIVISSS